MTGRRSLGRASVIRRAVAPALVALAVLGLAPAAASAATTCAHTTPGLLQVSMSESSDAAYLETRAGTIVVLGVTGSVTCAGVAPTVSNVDTILIEDRSDDLGTAAGNDGNTSVQIENPASFAPGKTVEPGQQSEIEFLADPLAGRDVLALFGAVKQTLIVGNGGAAWNADGDAEMAGMPFDGVSLSSGDGDDYLGGQGGSGTGAALSTAGSFRIDSGGGNDVLPGSEIPSGDVILAGAGNDSSIAYGGSDTIAPGAGDDTIQGGAGTDTLQFGFADRAVTVDLANTTKQDTGEGLDSFAGAENVVGSGFADTLMGDSAANVLTGSRGDDLLEGRAGADDLRGDQGTDTVSYAGSGAAVAIDLARTNQITDADKLAGIEDLVGSPFGDVLAGNPTENRIDAGAGSDTVAAGDGTDRVLVRDGEGDRVSCGGGVDTATADRRSVDSLAADCEAVDALPEPGGGTGDTTLSLALGAAKRQPVLSRRGVRVRVRCPLERCTVVTEGSTSLRLPGGGRKVAKLRLRPVRAELAAGSARTLTLRLKRGQTAAVRRALAAGRRPKWAVSARATDAAGNEATRAVRIEVRRAR